MIGFCFYFASPPLGQLVLFGARPRILSGVSVRDAQLGSRNERPRGCFFFFFGGEVLLAGLGKNADAPKNP